MQELINFFIELSSLKRNTRKRWETRGLDQVESTASHIFRVAVLSWCLAEKKKLDIEQVVKMALIHDLSGISTDEILSDPLINGTDVGQKEEMAEDKREKRHQALLELISDLPSNLKQELKTLYARLFQWVVEEAKFVEQADKSENFLQALEYWQGGKEIEEKRWFNWSDQVFDKPVFIELKETIEAKFINQSDSGPLADILNFLIKVGELKSKPRKGWELIGKEKPGTVAEHSYRTAIMAWFLGEQSSTKLNLGKVIKTALIHEITEIKTADHPPFSEEVLQDKEQWPDAFDRWPRTSKSDKEKNSLKEEQQEIEALKELTSELPSDLKKEIRKLQLGYIKKLSKEARFVKQVSRLEGLLQVLEYGEEDHKRPFRSWWVGTKELVDDPFLLKFLESLDEKFKYLEEKYPRRTLKVKS